MKKQRRHFTAEDKVKVLRRHLVEKIPVSDLCEEAGIHPTQFYDWQKVFFEKGALAFERASRPEGTSSKVRPVVAGAGEAESEADPSGFAGACRGLSVVQLALLRFKRLTMR
ncbi:MAG: transposase [Candidatus Hydrogenedentes bacterium]|nr:transposase [Candidatus Hydrogenedentota bacterium]